MLDKIFSRSQNYARKLDAAKGYVFTSQNSQFGGEYAHLSKPHFPTLQPLR